MAKKKTAEKAKIEAAPVLRVGGGDDPVVTKSYSMRDDWKDKDIVNYVAFKSVDGEVQDLTVNGEPAGGGGGDLTTAEVTLILDSGDLAGVSAIFIDNNTLMADQAVVDSDNPTHVYSFVLYQGKQYAELNTGTAKSTTGSVVYNSDRERYEITGNCTITLDGESIG